ncbi:coenzyme PQQ synthesis protein A (plasmid) [Sinorhizobium fredii NGR234]|uniref:Coenzyme PQQ synthesis protein A n=3 Tax=Rhizobium fredii TaxID=380 RepID=C3KNY2_SINFN|nr:coenzyme PQQ synthesis protein A [Sinorhizobium fredii NGR234]
MPAPTWLLPSARTTGFRSADQFDLNYDHRCEKARRQRRCRVLPVRQKADPAPHPSGVPTNTACSVLDPAATAPARAGPGTKPPEANGENMSWHAPKFIDVSCAMEITRYAPADGSEPVLF